MNNELLENKSFWKKNWKWFLPSIILIFLSFFVLILTASVEGNVADIAKAYSDNLLYENAIDMAKTNKRVLEVLGEIEPIDKLAIMEGNAIYSKNGNSVNLSVRIKGNKSKGKMDIAADKNLNVWKYKIINIRIKDTKEVIRILVDSIEKE
jgi:Cytochrome oxidase complex assembly protein 1